MKKLSALLIALTGILIFSGCSTDVDINASYEEITIVYGLLDPHEDTTYIKINKAFLGPDNALVMAKVPDSSQFIEKLDVRMWEQSSPENIIYFDTITISDKDTGTFYNPYQVLYYSPFQPDPTDKVYMLSILYNDTEITSEATTFNFSTVNIKSPGFALKIGFDNNNNTKSVAWDRMAEAPRYQVTIRFNFKEIWEGSPDTVYRYFDWYNDTKKAFSGNEVETYYTGATFYSALAVKTPYPDPAVEAQVLRRFTGAVNYIVDAAGTELNTYMDVTEPSNSIIQDRPEYSNITNGIGIFSTRSKAIKSKKLNDQTVFYIKEEYNYLKFVY
jgi:hypothetical protein